MYNIINPHLKALQPAQVHHVVAQLRNLGHQVHCFLFERETLRDRDRERDRDRDRQRDRERERHNDPTGERLYIGNIPFGSVI